MFSIVMNAMGEAEVMFCLQVLGLDGSNQTEVIGWTEVKQRQ